MALHVIAIYLMVTLVTLQSYGEDFCQTERMDAECGKQEVVVMTSAQYGRMQNGRCVRKDYGYIGCSADVLRLADVKCSGRRSCQIRVPDELFDITRPCPEDLKTYLEAHYTCIQVARPSQELCQATGFIKLEATSGYLSSLVTEETGCGTTTTPWILEALPGQQINLTLLDFTFVTMGSSFNLEYSDSFDGITWPGCRDLLIVKETDRETRLSNCFIRKRETLVYTSSTNTIEVQIIPNSEEAGPQFLLYYTASGCADPVPPPNGWLERQGYTAEVGCHSDEKIAGTLVCRDETWYGPRLNCTPPTEPPSKKSKWSFFQLSDELSIVLVLIIAIVIGLIILFFGVVCIKKRSERLQRQRAGQSCAEEITYAAGPMRDFSGKDFAVTIPRDAVIAKYDENDYAMIWEVQNARNAMRSGTKFGLATKKMPLRRASIGEKPPPEEVCCPAALPPCTSECLTYPYPHATICTQDCPMDNVQKYFELDPRSLSNCPPTTNAE